jgi:hypothetical protein
LKFPFRIFQIILSAHPKIEENRFLGVCGGAAHT